MALSTWLLLLATLASVAAAQDALCAEMQSGGSTWYCLDCGGDYSCKANFSPDDFCIVQGNNVPGCSLSSEATEWYCCRYCNVYGNSCEYQAPSGGSTGGGSGGGTTTGGGGGGGDGQCTDCSAGGDCYQACVSKCGGADNISNWSCEQLGGLMNNVCDCDKTYHDSGWNLPLSRLDILLIVVAGVLALLCCSACIALVVVVAVKLGRRHPAGYQAVQ